MPRKNAFAALLMPAALLAGCSMDMKMPSMDSLSLESLWPSFLDEEPKITELKKVKVRPPTKIAIRPSKGEKADQPLVNPGSPPKLNSTNFVPPKITSGQETGTFVGQKVKMLRDELKRMQSEITSHNESLQKMRAQTKSNAELYHNSIGSINSRLQVGTTPGNPYLVKQWNIGQQQLSKIDGDIGKMNSLANAVAGSSTMSSYLLETTRAAYGITGAVDDDHRQLAILEDEVNRTVVLIDRLLNELSEDIARQSAYVSNERSNLTTLSLAIKNGELLGSSLANRAYAPRSNYSIISGPDPVSNRSPLVVIRFDRPNIQYKQALYTAVNQALKRRPDAGFDIVAVTAAQGSGAKITVESNKAKRNAEAVLRSLSEMGLSLDRVRLSSKTSRSARSNEVHLFVR